MPSPNTWTSALGRIFRDFLSIEDVGPDWLVEPGTGRQLGVDVLYPELGIAFWFKRSRGAMEPGGLDYEVILTRLCGKAGISLVALVPTDDVDARTLVHIRATLSGTARRVAQQRGAREAKRDLLPRIASAKTACQKMLDDLATPPPGGGASSRRAPGG